MTIDKTNLVTTIRKSPFMSAYVECALWLGSDYRPDMEGANDYSIDLRGDYDVWDLSADTLQTIVDDCMGFAEYVFAALTADEQEIFDEQPEQAGHDFYLTRNRHGAGFWDRPDYWPGRLAQELTDIARTFGDFSLCLYDDSGTVEHMG